MTFSSIYDLWSKWNIRGFVILSLSLQVFLILFARLRKITANNHIIFLLWLAYLMADWVAAYVIGLISHNQGNSSTHVVEIDGALQAFWASFLLLHLGGPDTITAFSLEDSSLWRRHLLSLVFQVGAAIYVFAQIFPNNKLLVIPTMLVFLAGFIKNAERLLALNLSSLPRLRESMHGELLGSVRRRSHERDQFDKVFKDLPNGNSDEAEEEEEEEEEVAEEEAAAAARAKEEAKLAESIVVKHAHYFFEIFKVIIGDLMYTSKQREMSRKYFRKVSAVDALRVISVELHFIYEVLYTKALTIRSKWSCIFRFIAFADIAMALVLFNRLKKHHLPQLDVKITYSLLFGGIALDGITLFMLVFSDWTIAKIKWYDNKSSKLNSFLHKFVSAMDGLRKPRIAKYKAEPTDVSYKALDTPFIFRRWSESISACNLFSESYKKSPRKMCKLGRCWGINAFVCIYNFKIRVTEKIISCTYQAIETIATCFCLKKGSTIVNAKYVSKNPIIEELWIFIFKEVKRKSKYANDPITLKEIFEARGDLFLENDHGGVDCGNLLQYITGVDYDFSVIIWHLATEICYNRGEQDTSSTAGRKEREFSKILSDYMLYLLLNQPNMMSAVAGFSQNISGVTLNDLRAQIKSRTNLAKDVKRLCNALYEVRLELEHLEFTLEHGVKLAREMDTLGEKKWEVMNGVWVEMLLYAASHIKGEAHIQVLSKGGELLTFVWLLMAHFGCFHKPEWTAYHIYRDEIFNWLP